MFLRNYWYVCAWPHEVGRDMLARTICNEPVILFRREDGTPAALEDRCCHRHLPLSEGKLVGDAVQCGYHGLMFDTAGACVQVPGQTHVPPDARIKAYPVTERYGLVWIWMGDTARADEALIPDTHQNDHPDWTSLGGVTHIACNYQLFVDNLLDLTHETFVHVDTIGHETVAATPMKASWTDDTVTVERWMLGFEPPPYFAKLLGTSGKVDRWQYIYFYPPCHLRLDVGVAIAGTGAPEGDRSQGITTWVINSITPETERSMYSFWALPRDFARDDEELTQRLTDQVRKIILEDKVVVEAQQRSLDLTGEDDLIDINADAGALRARRIIAELLAKEAAEQRR